MLLDNLTPEEVGQAFLFLSEGVDEQELPPKLQLLTEEDWLLLQGLLVNLMVSKGLSTLH
jgi:hypothetical protein